MSKATCDFASPPTNEEELDFWEPDRSDLKTYRHFDAILPLKQISALVRNSKRVAEHTFRPLLQFEKSWRRPPKDGVQQEPKIRKISYACRKDAYIYKHYREILSHKYESILKETGLTDCVIAYRRIPVSHSSKSCKSNINFAKEAFDSIAQLKTCCAVAIDISDYFGSINHENLKACWKRLIGKSHLPEDHYSVFKSITEYRYVDSVDAMVALGYSKYDKDGRLRFVVKPSDIPIQICTPDQYRKKIIDQRLVQKHPHSYGIPQGTPISDLLANAYLLKFDQVMNEYAAKKGGYYFRYSDDILLIIPGDGRAARGAFAKAKNEISKIGSELKLKDEKTDIVCYFEHDSEIKCYSLKLMPKTSSRKRASFGEGLSYLGFRFDGKRVYLRNSTVTALKGKIARTCKAAAFSHIYRHINKDIAWLRKKAPVSEVRQKFFEVKDFDPLVQDAVKNGNSPFKLMTFLSYVKRAEAVFGKQGAGIRKQIRGLQNSIDYKLDREIGKKYYVVQTNK